MPRLSLSDAVAVVLESVRNNLLAAVARGELGPSQSTSLFNAAETAVRDAFLGGIDVRMCDSGGVTIGPKDGHVMDISPFGLITTEADNRPDALVRPFPEDGIVWDIAQQQDLDYLDQPDIPLEDLEWPTPEYL
jgi:hypothetical protein